MTAVPSNPAQESQSGYRLSPRQWLILLTVQVTTLTFGMAVTVANVVMPQMKGALSATQDQIAWVVTFNLVATAIATPMTGWLSRTFGWRNLMIGSLIGFMVSTLFCGFATSLEILILFRVAQGLFGAPLMPLGQGVLLASFPRHMHPLIMMMWGFGGVMGPILGPVLGGIVADALDWRWAFFMIIPFAGVAALGAWASFGHQERGTAPKLDWIGFLSLAVAVGAAQLMFDRGHREDWFESPEILLEAAAAVIGIYIFIAHTLTARISFLSRELFLDRNFVLGVIMAFAMGWLSYTPIVLFPPLLQDLRGYPESIVGYLISARGIGNWLSFFIVVQCTKHSPRMTLCVGIALQAMAGWAMANLDINMTDFDVFWTNLLQGFGFGLAYTPMSVLAFSTLNTRLMTEGSSVFNMMRNFGSSIFISVSVLVFVRTTTESYATLGSKISPYNEALRFPDVVGSWSLETTGQLAQLSAEVYRQASMIGYINAFHLFTLAAALAVPLALLFRRTPRMES